MIRFGGLRITTVPPACLDFGASLQFDAEISEGVTSGVGWSASAGTIDSETGAFTAPGEAATVEITVFLVDNPAIRDSITVIVGCVCSGQLIVDGVSPQTTAVNFTVAEGGGAVFEVGWVSDLVENDGLSEGAQFELVTPVPFGQTGEYDVHGGGLFTDADLGVFFSSDETGPLLLAITANEGGERVAGTVSGSVHAAWQEGTLVPLGFTFDVRVDPTLTYSDGTYDYRSCTIGG